ncbi:DUF4309 domain-containing protein [Shimazuella sp. AN120528]|uniref:DUF4309 domain-containing protein n=1 Tax=Shimazuella soli TaxID=1892854 RepID=UPI001F0E6F7F|nr:DUF4309 domain-containing protein [Shimazuella soli]MCH5584822.1 DUF4309 domain-containing protein [Shimazuella soli]
MRKGFICVFIVFITIFLTACGSGYSDSNKNTNFSGPNQSTSSHPQSDDSWVSDQQKWAEQNMSVPEKLVNDIMLSAEKGTMYPDSKVALGDTSQTVINAYGSPEKSDGTYMDYSQSHAVSFGLENGTVYQIGSTNPQFQSLTQNDITNILGKPTKSAFEGGSEYYEYQLKNNYRLFFNFDGNKVYSVSVQ